MSKNKGAELTPAEKYLRQLDPDRDQIRRRDLLYVSKKEADSLYRPVHKYEFSKTNRIVSIAALSVFPIGTLVVLYFIFREKLFGGLFVVAALIAVPILLFLAIKDGLRPARKNSADDQSEE